MSASQHTKRARGKTRARFDDEGVEMVDVSAAQRLIELEEFREALSKFEAASDTVFSSKCKDQLAAAVWTTRSGLEANERTASNTALAEVLNDVTSNRRTSGSAGEIEFMMTNLARVKSQNNLPLLTARISLEALTGPQRTSQFGSY